MSWTIARKCVSKSLLLVSIILVTSRVEADDAKGQIKRLDVNDISILWPAPKIPQDAKILIAVDEKLADGITSIWPEPVFRKILETAQSVTVTGSGTLTGHIAFNEHKAAFESPSNWKIAGIRIDPSAPGCSDKLIRIFGMTPQIRLVVQPVTFRGSTAIVHDVTAHLVFDFVLGTEPPVAAGLPRRPVPDLERFKAALDDLTQFKADLLAAGVNTDGHLDVHPAFKANQQDFSDKVKTFLRKHLTGDRLSAVAFMGIDSPEPWTFFAMAKRDGDFIRVSHPSLQTEQAQMLTFRGGDHVMPHPLNSMFGKGIGVSTAPLFEPISDLSAAELTGPAPAGTPSATLRDIPDIIANPQISHFFNTDCVSCHSESTRRAILGLQGASTQFQFQRPAKISGVSNDVLPTHRWNVRNFGWFPNFFDSGKTVESVSLRTANEAAESAEFINRNYFGDLPQDEQPPSVTNALTLVMTIKSSDDRAKLKELIASMQKLPPDKNPIAVALTKLGTVHFARFVFIGDDKLAVITAYDDDFEAYIHSFANEIGDVFDQLLKHMKDAPPLPVKENRQSFLEYVKKNNLACEPPFFSAYPTLKVQDILTLQKKAAK